MIAEDIADLLENEGVGTVGTDIFIGLMPDSPVNSMVVIDSSGREPDTELPLTQPSFQIVIRNASYSTGRTLLKTVFDTLHRKANFTINSSYVYIVLANSQGGYIGRNDNGIDEFSINFRAKVRDV